MVVTDPIADMLTRIRNALIAKHDEVDIPASKTKKAIADILLEEGYIAGVENSDEGTIKSKIKITLKYSKHGKVISGLRRISKPGLRVYAKSEDMPKVLKGLGIAILSTPRASSPTSRRARRTSAARFWRSSGKGGEAK